MNDYEILPIGFDGGTDKMDHLVKWVRAKEISHARRYAELNGMDPESVTEITFMTAPWQMDGFINKDGEMEPE